MNWIAFGNSAINLDNVLAVFPTEDSERPIPIVRVYGAFGDTDNYTEFREPLASEFLAAFNEATGMELKMVELDDDHR